MKPHILFAFLLSSLCSLCLRGESSAALNPGLKTPYDLKVVLHFARHQTFTDVFKDRVQREMHDGLQASFGDLVNVSVQTVPDDAPAGDKLADVVKNGLKSLDGWHERSGVKTHFVFIDYSGVYYEMQSRQFDGLTGTASPLVRRDRTRDRDFVAKAAALLVEKDFGLVGVFDAWPKEIANKPGEDQPVTLSLQGGGLGAPLDRWIQKGDVFAAVQMPPGDSGPGRPVLGALLQVETPPAAGDASCVCRVFRRYARPTGAGVAGYRCIKLGTTSGPVRLRLLQALRDGGVGPLKDALTVQIRHNGFEDDAGKVQKPTDNADAVDTTGDKNGLFDHAAFVSVFSTGDNPQARVPLPLLDDQPVVLAIYTDAQSLDAFSRHAFEQAVQDAWRQQSQLFTELNDLAAKPEKRDETIKLIQDGLDQSRNAYERLSQEKQELSKTGPVSQTASELLVKLNEGTNELKDFLDKMKKIDAEENDPKKKAWLAAREQGQRLEKDLEIDKALAIYDRILMEGFQDDKLKEYTAKLHKEWKPQNEEHRKARAFIYGVWPTLDDAGIKAQIDEAKAAIKRCEDAVDTITLRKFLRGSDVQVLRMKQELGELRPDINVGDEKPAKLIKDDFEAMASLASDVNQYLKTAPPDK